MNIHEPLPFGENGEASAKEVPNEGPPKGLDTFGCLARARGNAP